MALTIGILMALVSMFGWGIADFLANKGVDAIGEFKSLLINQISGVIPIMFISIFVLDIPLFSPQILLMVFLCGFFNTVSYIMFYRGMKIGNLSIVSPIASSWVLILVIFSLFFFGEQLTYLQIVSIVIIISGIILSSFKFSELKRGLGKGMVRGIPEALFAMFGWGFTFFFLKFVVDVFGEILSVLLVRFVAIGILSVYGFGKKVKFQNPGRMVLLFLVFAGLLDAMAFMTFNIGITTDYLSIISPIAACFPAVTIILAMVFFKEKLVLNQWIGIVMILIGLVLMAVI